MIIQRIKSSDFVLIYMLKPDVTLPPTIRLRLKVYRDKKTGCTRLNDVRGGEG